MTENNAALTRQMLEWIAERPRARSEVLDAWRTSCPRLSIWEDACLDGLIEYEVGSGRVTLSRAGLAFLAGTTSAVLRDSPHRDSPFGETEG